jgi:hypothetical protein
MSNTDFNTSFKALLKAFNTHEDLRQRGADISSLAKSNYELHKARMATYHSFR